MSTVTKVVTVNASTPVEAERVAEDAIRTGRAPVPSSLRLIDVGAIRFGDALPFDQVAIDAGHGPGRSSYRVTLVFAKVEFTPDSQKSESAVQANNDNARRFLRALTHTAGDEVACSVRQTRCHDRP